MSDIVERLRESASRDQVVSRNWGDGGWDVTGQLEEAADEIGRLRAALTEIKDLKMMMPDEGMRMLQRVRAIARRALAENK